MQSFTVWNTELKSTGIGFMVQGLLQRVPESGYVFGVRDLGFRVESSGF